MIAPPWIDSRSDPPALVVAFAPSGRAILYLLGHSGPNLWTTTIAGRQLIRRRRLISNPSLDAYAS